MLSPLIGAFFRGIMRVYGGSIMAAIRFVWGYKAGLFIIGSIWAGHAIASGSSEYILPAVDWLIALCLV